MSDLPISVGIDIGTGSIKAVAIDSKGNVVASQQEFYKSDKIDSEQDPELIWNCFLRALDLIIKKLKKQPAVITLSSCMHSLILIDDNDNPITPMIGWSDNRSEGIASELRKSAFAADIYYQSGTPIHAMSPLCKIIWFQKNQQDLFKRTTKFIGIKEFIWFRLFGSYQIDISLASATGLFNIETLSWNNQSLQLCGIHFSQLSEPVNTSYTRVGPMSMDFPENINDIPFCIGSSDGCLANVGSFVRGKDAVAITVGTSGAVRVTNSKPIMDFQHMPFNYLLDENTFICGGPVNNGGNVISWLIKNFSKTPEEKKIRYGDYFSSIEKIPAGSDGLIFLPYLLGERSPVWDEKSAASFLGIRNTHSREHFLRAGLEGVCYSLKQILELLQQSKNSIESIHVSGGFITEQVWLHMLADVTGKKVKVFYNEDASAIGAAMLGLSSQNIKNDRVYIREPLYEVIPNTLNRLLYDKVFGIYIKLYPLLKDLLHAIHNSQQITS